MINAPVEQNCNIVRNEGQSVAKTTSYLLEIFEVTNGSIFFNRREAMFGSAAGLASLSCFGCGKKPEPVATTAGPTRTDVPLRIGLLCDQDEADVVERGWTSVSEQPVRISAIPPNRLFGSELISQLVQAAKRNDVLSVPLMAIPELVSLSSIVVLSGDNMSEAVSDLFPALRSGVARYASETYALPIKSSLPAVFAVGSDSPDEPGLTWNEYHRWVDSQWNGQCGEPIAGGWAGTMFLWRAVGRSERSLFSRENLQPLIEESSFVDALSLMKKTVDCYEHSRQTPLEIWQRLCDGGCRGGITFPHTEDTEDQSSEREFSVIELPNDGDAESSLGKRIFDPWLPVAVMSADCRQSDASKLFLDWISGAEGSRSARQKIAPSSPVRVSDRDTPRNDYSTWLASQLQSPLTTPTLELLSAGKYYDALELNVMRCLDGKESPVNALAEVAAAWRDITQQVGVEKQLEAWRRAHGMSG